LHRQNGGATKVKADDLDPAWKALSDPTRRAILDLLRQGPRTTTEIVDAFPHLTRFGVMKHIDVLREADIIETRQEGRQRINSLNVVPIRQIYERWVGRFEELWSSHLLRIKEIAENREAGDAPATQKRKKGWTISFRKPRRRNVSGRIQPKPERRKNHDRNATPPQRGNPR
jgi:DNA-binding transcriptional ArsR family regulator